MDQVNENAARRQRAEEQNNEAEDNKENESGNNEEQPEVVNTPDDNSNKKETIADKTKKRIKKKIVIAIISSGILIPTLFLLLMVTSVAIALDLFDSSGSSSGGSSNLISGSTTYLECRAITVDGKQYSLDDYVAGVIQHEAYTSEGIEALKAQAVAARSYVIVGTNNCSKAAGNSEGFQTFSANPGENAKKASLETSGQVMVYNNKILRSEYDSFCYHDSRCKNPHRNSDGSYSVTYTKEPNGEQHTVTLSNSKYYGMMTQHGHGRGMSQLVSYQMAAEGKDYKEILGYFYSPGVQISSLTAEKGNNDGGIADYDNQGYGKIGTFTTTSGVTYKNYKQCYDKYANTGKSYDWLCSVGCGLTSTAIIISGTNPNITPEYLYDNYRAKEGYVDMDKYLSTYGKTFTRNDSGGISKKQLIEKLKAGGTGIIRFNGSPCIINGEKWTSSQHFVAVLAYRSSDNSIYISNPGDALAKNGWYNIDNLFSSNSCSVTVNYLVD